MSIIFYTFILILALTFAHAIFIDFVNIVKYFKLKFSKTFLEENNNTNKPRTYTMKNVIFLSQYSNSLSIIENELLKDYFNECYPFILVSLNDSSNCSILPSGHLVLTKKDISNILNTLKTFNSSTIC